MNATSRSGPARPLFTAAIAAALILSGSGAAAAAGSSASPAPSAAEAALGVQAQELAGQIQADGRNLDQMAEALDAAQIRSHQLAAQMGTLQTAMARTDTQAATVRAALKQQALLSYMAGGAPLVSRLPDRSRVDPSLTVSYAEIVTGGQRRVVAAYRAVLDEQGRQAQQLADARRAAVGAVSQLQADRAAAAAAVAARQRTLAEVRGRLATLVAQVQLAQQRAEQTAVKANLSRQGQLPPASPPVSTAPPPSSSPPAPSGPTAHPTTTSAPHRATPTTAPPRTSPPTTAPPPPPPIGNTPARGSGTAVRYAYAQLGKPYQWGGSGPGSFDCSGLTMMAWAAAGVYLPHLAQDQYALTRRIPLASTVPGDLIFFGTPTNVYHVGIYIGGGDMIDAPATGQVVSISSIYWADLLGAGRIIN